MCWYRRAIICEQIWVAQKKFHHYHWISYSAVTVEGWAKMDDSSVMYQV